MANTWFIYSNDVVSGPFSTDEVRSKLSSGQLDAKAFIWWRGQREWVPVASWMDQLPKLLESATNQEEKAVWYIDLGSAPIGPLTQRELIENLLNVSELGRVRLWAVGMAAWVSLFEVQEVMEQLGISRREHERAPIMGTVAVTRSNDAPKGFVLKLSSLSLGGIGASGSHDLRRGDDVALLLKSGDLPTNVHLRGEIVYVTSAGYVGIRFQRVSAEAQGIILDYVKRFTGGGKTQAA